MPSPSPISGSGSPAKLNVSTPSSPRSSVIHFPSKLSTQSELQSAIVKYVLEKSYISLILQMYKCGIQSSSQFDMHSSSDSNDKLFSSQ